MRLIKINHFVDGLSLDWSNPNGIWNCNGRSISTLSVRLRGKIINSRQRYQHQ